MSSLLVNIIMAAADGMLGPEFLLEATMVASIVHEVLL